MGAGLLARIGGCGICGSSGGAKRGRNHGVVRRVENVFAPEIKTPTMLDAAGPSPNGVLLAGFNSRVQPSPNGVLLAGFKSRVQRWVGGASQPAFLKVVLRFR